MFFGPNEIISSVEENGFVTVTMSREDGETYSMKVPTIVYEKVSTEDKRDWNYVQDVKLNAVTGEMLEIMEKWGVTGGELKPLLNKIAFSFINVIDRALNFKFTGDDKSFVPGGDLYFDLTMNRANEIIKEINATEPTDSSAA